MSDFLKNLNAALDKGEFSEEVKAKFTEIVTKAEERAPDFDTMEKADAKVKQVEEKRKPLTADEIKTLNEQAIKQQAAIDDFDREMKIKAALVTIDLRVNRIKLALAEYGIRYEKLKDTTLTTKEKNELVQELLFAVNNNDNFTKHIVVSQAKDKFNERDSK